MHRIDRMPTASTILVVSVPSSRSGMRVAGFDKCYRLTHRFRDHQVKCATDGTGLVERHLGGGTRLAHEKTIDGKTLHSPSMEAVGTATRRVSGAQGAGY